VKRPISNLGVHRPIIGALSARFRYQIIASFRNQSVSETAVVETYSKPLVKSQNIRIRWGRGGQLSLPKPVPCPPIFGYSSSIQRGVFGRLEWLIW